MQPAQTNTHSSRRAGAIIPQGQLGRLILDSFKKLNPVYIAKNPVMFIVEVGTVITLFLTLERLFTGQTWGYELAITVLLLLTVLFATFAESVAEARGKAQAASLRAARADTPARKVLDNGSEQIVSSTQLAHDDLVRVADGQLVPADGEIVHGWAMVDESAITGESAPVLREAGGDFSSVTGGTKVISDEITVRVTSLPGESFLDRMIALVEGANRQKTPNEIALGILLAGFTLIFVLVVATLLPMAAFIGMLVGVIRLKDRSVGAQ